MVVQLLFQLLIIVGVTTASASSFNITKPGCQERCGKVNIPYPFGVGNSSNCFRDEGFKFYCNDTGLFTTNESNIGVDFISLEGQMQVSLRVSFACYNESGKAFRQSYRKVRFSKNRPYRFSDTRTKFTVVGCDTAAFVEDRERKVFETGCISGCTNFTSITNGSCSGNGCCQVSIPKNIKRIRIRLDSSRSNDSLDFNNCSYAFLVDQERFNFSASYLNGFPNRTTPVMLDWVVGNETCEDAKRIRTSYACGDNTDCYNSSLGYLCKCSEGYQGNPYLLQGCQDIDECADGKTCKWDCVNAPGTHYCNCPPGMRGDGNYCSNKFPAITVSIVIMFGTFTLFAGSYLLYEALMKKKLIRLKEIFFQKNGGLLLQQQRAEIFTAKELENASNNYNENQIIGRGGYGTVYKGILADQRIVAIKKSKIVDESQIEQFINEVGILSQINHRNVVKLLGCCLETKVPVLVYEFVSHGTLSEHIHSEGHTPLMSWENRLRVAAETAGALAYLHSAAYPPIIHRDVKSTNILLDENNTAKVSDFGASMLVPLDQTKVATFVQGTLGYLDPEYFQTGDLTVKSDVYSFGVVLLELLTGKKPLSFGRSQEKNLVKYFISSMKENSLFQILEAQVANEGEVEQLQAVAKLAESCLRMKGEERPSMKEVAVELERLRKFREHPWVKQNHEEIESLLVEPAYGFASNGTESSQNITATSIELGSYGSSSTL